MILTYDPAKEKRVNAGTIVGDTLVKEVDSLKHFMHIVDGYGIQKEVAEMAKEKGIMNVLIKETNTGINWKSALADWFDHGKLADYGNGKQYFLSLKYMKQ